MMQEYSMSNEEHKLYNIIDGQKCPPQEGKYLSKCNPATGTELYKIPQSTKEDVDRAVFHLFDRDLNPKPAYEAIYNAASCCDCL